MTFDDLGHCIPCSTLARGRSGDSYDHQQPAYARQDVAVDCSLDDPASFGGRSGARIRSTGKCRYEGLSHGRVTVACFKRPLV